MKEYKKRVAQYWMDADSKPKGDMKKILQRQVRRDLNKAYEMSEHLFSPTKFGRETAERFFAEKDEEL